MIAFNQPLYLLLLPLALLPLWPNRRDFIPFPWIDWLPDDVVGQRLHRIALAVAVLTLLLLVIGLAGPSSPATVVERVGRGAEIAILLDRSASMDSGIVRKIQRDYQLKQVVQTKNEIARNALSWLLEQRPENRYSLTLFHVVPMRVAEFTDDIGFVQAGLDASGIGRGAKETNMGAALLAAINGFEQRPYTGNRVLLLVSDGGAKIDAEIRQKIRQGLQRNQVSLYFIYVNSGINNADFSSADELVGVNPDALSEEVALHVFFNNLGIPYQVFQAEDEQSMADAIAIIDKQQNSPLTYYERVLGQDYSWWAFMGALLSCLGLTLLMMVRLEALR